MQWTRHTQSHHNHTHAKHHTTNTLPEEKKQHLTFEEGSMISIWQHVYRMQIRMLLLFHSLANSISCFFFARISSRTWYRTYINFILRWCFNAAPHSFSHSLSPSANVYFRGCVCIFLCGMSFLIIVDLLAKFVLFWLFLLVLHTSILLIHFDGLAYFVFFPLSFSSISPRFIEYWLVELTLPLARAQFNMQATHAEVDRVCVCNKRHNDCWCCCAGNCTTQKTQLHAKMIRYSV